MTTNKRYWLGKPNGRMGMIRLPSLEAGAAVPIRRAEAPSTLLGGGAGNAYAPLPKRTWKLKRSWLTQAEQEILRALYLGRPDRGPFRFLDPGERNLLNPDASTFGGFTADTSFWVPSAATFTRDAATTNYPALTDATRTVRESDALFTGVLTTSSQINSQTTDLTTRIPRIPGVNYDFSFWAALVSGTSVTLRAGLAGSSVAVNVGTSIPAGWARVSVNATDALLGAPSPFVDMRISVVAASGSPTVNIRAPQLSISDATEEYTLGLGVPNVIFSGGGGLDQDTPRTKYRDLAFTLGEI